jgi:hypothetical protein
MQWFAVGVGLPLIGVALITGLSSNDPQPATVDTPVMTATDTAEPLIVDTVDDEELASSPSAPIVAPEPEPQFDTLVLTVGRGDTMERLFRKKFSRSLTMKVNSCLCTRNST